jgi:hypothetical protein
MQTALDTELFPDLCEVVEMPLHNQWVYLIQKNGNSSLREQQAKDNLAMFTNEEISVLDYVDVYIRNPRERYISGVNTYLQHLQRDYPELDYSTTFCISKHISDFFVDQLMKLKQKKADKLKISCLITPHQFKEINSRRL